MFIKNLSEEAYLQFAIEHSEHSYLVDWFTKPFVEETYTLASSTLFGYVTVTDIPTGHNNVFAFEPKHNRYFLPIREIFSTRIPQIRVIGPQRPPELFKKVGGCSLDIEQLNGIMENRKEIRHPPLKNPYDWKYSVKDIVE